MLSTTASLGMLMLWDVEMGLDKIDPYTNVDEDLVKVRGSCFQGSHLIC